MTFDRYHKVNDGETRTYGVFTAIECARGQIVLHVRAPGQTLLLRASQFDAIDFISYRSSTPGRRESRSPSSCCQMDSIPSR